MANAMKVKPPSIRARKWMTSIVWRWSYIKNILLGKTPTITRETARAAHEMHYYDQSKLLKALPDFRYKNLQTSIERIAESMNKIGIILKNGW